MKILVYTCNDLQHSLPCVDLLYNSLLKNNTSDSFDFAVVCNNRSHQKVDYNVLYDESYPQQFVGFTRYSSVIPSGYDFYLYLDSDILFYDKIENVLPSEYNGICVATEGNNLMINSPYWHSYGYVDKINKKGNHRPCVNSGEFSFGKSSNLLSMVRENLMSLYSHEFDSMTCAMYEQSSYNYTMIDLWDCVNTSKLTSKLSFCPEKDSHDKTIFHFAGFQEGMIHKHQRMMNFIQTHKKG